MEVIRSSETSVLTRATMRLLPEQGMCLKELKKSIKSLRISENLPWDQPTILPRLLRLPSQSPFVLGL
jgi:hypothetical protein